MGKKKYFLGWMIGVCALVAAALPGAAAPPERAEHAVTVAAGDSTTLEIVEDAAEATTIRVQGKVPDGLTVTTEDEPGRVAIAASLGATAGGTVTLQVRHCPRGKGCSPDKIAVAVDVIAARDDPAGPLEPQLPSDDRVADAVAHPLHGMTALRDEVLVLVAAGTGAATIEAIAQSVSGFLVGGGADGRLLQIGFDAPIDRDATVASLNSRADVQAAAPSVHLDVDVTPADFLDYADDSPAHWWHHEMTGADELWVAGQYSTAPVGVIDYGMDTQHTDLAATGAGPTDPHGTHVGGLACALLNGRGLAGTAGGCPVVGTNMHGWMAFAIDQMYYLTRNDVPVVNMSLGYSSGITRCIRNDGGASYPGADVYAARQASVAHVEEMARAAATGNAQTLFVVSAGNGCNNAGDDPFKAGLLDQPNVVAVASVNASGELSRFSAAGPGVDMAAPGGVYDTRDDGGDRNEGVFSTIPGDGYDAMAGTSMAAPQVAGAASLMLSRNSELAPEALANCLTSTATVPVKPRSQYPTWVSSWNGAAPSGSGLGILNVPAAVACAGGTGGTSDMVSAVVPIDVGSVSRTAISSDGTAGAVAHAPYPERRDVLVVADTGEVLHHSALPLTFDGGDVNNVLIRGMSPGGVHLLVEATVQDGGPDSIHRDILWAIDTQTDTTTLLFDHTYPPHHYPTTDVVQADDGSAVFTSFTYEVGNADPFYAVMHYKPGVGLEVLSNALLDRSDNPHDPADVFGLSDDGRTVALGSGFLSGSGLRLIDLATGAWRWGPTQSIFWDEFDGDLDTAVSASGGTLNVWRNGTVATLPIDVNFEHPTDGVLSSDGTTATDSFWDGSEGRTRLIDVVDGTTVLLDRTYESLDANMDTAIRLDYCQSATLGSACPDGYYGQVIAFYEVG